MKQITFVANFTAWQAGARQALSSGIAPERIGWQEFGAADAALPLFEETEGVVAPGTFAQFSVPKAFVQTARLVALHTDDRRWGLLYRVLWRLTHGERKLMEIAVDPDIAQLREWEKAIRHGIHKMRAFVRFREVARDDGVWYVAWFEPQHHILEQNASFFVDRFAGMRWSILTPDRCAHWDGKALHFTPGVEKAQVPTDDNVEGLWLTYYANIFNPARVKVRAMQAEMPKKYWPNLPEAALIPELLNAAPRRVEAMIKKSSTKVTTADDKEWQPAPVPQTASLRVVATAAKACTACHLYKRATQTVFGEGAKGATMMFLGEQPGDQEDLVGQPFVGPAGKLLDRALAEAGIDRAEVYVTNTVKHFKWEPRGKRRIHQKPNSREIAACRPWMEAELRLVKPKVLVCLGATAAQSIFGAAFRVTRERGKVLASELAPLVLATVHPSSLLRQPDEESRAREYALFVDDLRTAARGAAK